MIVLLEVIDVYNEFERKMQISSYAVRVLEGSKVNFTESYSGKPQFGVDEAIVNWARLDKLPDITANEIEEHFDRSLKKVNGLIDQSAKIVEWGNHLYLLGNLKSKNHFNLKLTYRGDFTLERAIKAIRSEMEISKSTIDRLDALNELYLKVREDMGI